MNLTPKDVEIVVAARFKLTVDELRGLDKHRRICRPRQIAMFLARELTSKSLPQLGRHFGRDHTTVYKGIQRVRTLIARSPKIAAVVEECRAAMPSMDERRAKTAELVERLHRGEVSWVREAA